MPLSRLPSPPELDIDPFSREVLIDPREYHAALRKAGPVVRLTRYGTYASGRYDQVKTIVADYKRFTSAAGMGLTDIRKPGAWRKASPLAEVDPPEHTDIRSVLTRIISPAVIRSWREAFQEEADRVVASVLDRGEINAVSEIAQEFVLTAFPKMFGMSMVKEYALLIGEMNFNQLGPQNEILEASLRKVEPILDWYEESFQRGNMFPNGMGEKIYQAEDDGRLKAGTGAPHVRGFVRGGTDTTIAGISHTLHHLARNPDQWALLKADPSLARGAFDEAIRLESPVQVLFRTTTQDMEFEGYRLDGDTKIAMSFAAANRDPDKWEDPDSFRIDRQTAGQHLALGAGPHMCIGQTIARLEAECVLTALTRRVRAIELTGEPTIKPINTVRTLDTLPLRIVPEPSRGA